MAPTLNNGFSMPVALNCDFSKEVLLNNGTTMPIMGLGFFRVEGKDCKDLLFNAIKIGYRNFDCAAKYGNEEDVGKAFAEAFETGLIKREELFITSKVWNSDHGHVVEACQDTLKKLQLDYLDMYLVHYPFATPHTGVGTPGSVKKDGVLDIDVTISLESVWRQMETLVDMGLVRGIGLSNFSLVLLRDCLAYSKIKPAVLQTEMHPYFQRETFVKFCQKHGVQVMAHTPLGGATANAELYGSASCLDDSTLQGLAKKYRKTVAQIVLRWGIQRKTVVIPKSSKTKRLEENLGALDFDLADDDMELIRSIDRDCRSSKPGLSWGVDIYT